MRRRRSLAKSLFKWIHGWLMVYWGDENLSSRSDFIFVTCSIFFQCPVYLPLTPTSRKRDSERTPGGTMQVVSFKKMRMRTTRRLDITNSRRESGTTFCCLEIVEPEYGGNSCFSVATNHNKNNYNYQFFCILWKKHHNRSPDPRMKLSWRDQRSKFVLDSSSNESMR